MKKADTSVWPLGQATLSSPQTRGFSKVDHKIMISFPEKDLEGKGAQWLEPFPFFQIQTINEWNPYDSLSVVSLSGHFCPFIKNEHAHYELNEYIPQSTKPPKCETEYSNKKF